MQEMMKQKKSISNTHNPYEYGRYNFLLYYINAWSSSKVSIIIMKYLYSASTHRSEALCYELLEKKFLSFYEK